MLAEVAAMTEIAHSICQHNCIHAAHDERMQFGEADQDDADKPEIEGEVSRMFKSGPFRRNNDNDCYRLQEIVRDGQSNDFKAFNLIYSIWSPALKRALTCNVRSRISVLQYANLCPNTEDLVNKARYLDKKVNGSVGGDCYYIGKVEMYSRT